MAINLRSGAAAAIGLCFLGVVACAPQGNDKAIPEPGPDNGIAASRPAAPLRPAASPASADQAGSNRNAAPPPISEIVRGTGRFLKASAAPARPISVGGDGVMLNFVNADVRDVIRSILGDLLQENYLIDPTIQAIVTIQSNRPIARSAVLPSLEAALSLNGLAIVSADGILKVVPAGEAARVGAAMEGVARPRTQMPGYRIRIVPLSFVSTEEMQRVLEPLVPQGSIHRIDQARNLLVLGGTESEIAAMLEAVDTFDVDWLRGMSFGLFQLKAALAKTMVNDLTEVLGGQAGPIGKVVRFIPIERMNAVLAISPNASYLNVVREWIDRLDRGSDSQDQRIYVYFVQNGRANDLAAVLNKVLGNQAQSGTTASARPLDTVYLPQIGQRPPIELPRPQPIPETSPEQPAFPAAPPAAGATGADDGIRVRDTKRIRITADEINNALLIYGTSQDFLVIEAALRKLDIVPLQVLIEAAVAEVTLTNELRYGVQFFIRSGNFQFLLNERTTTPIAPTPPGFSFIFSSSANTTVILDLLKSFTNVEVISSPQLFVLNNQTATLQVGDQVPIATSSAVSVISPGAPVVNSIQLQDTGVILNVTPRVNESGLVRMDISQEVSSVARTTTSGIDSPTIQQRKIRSSIAVRDGETIALGGLIQDSKTNSRSGIPVLGDIPLLGNLFSQTDHVMNRTELLVLITPRVVRNDQQAFDVTSELRRKLRATNPLLQSVK